MVGRRVVSSDVDPSFDPLHEQLRHVDDLPVPWYVAGGWAIDLFLGRVTREHQDVDLAIARADQRPVYEHLTDRTWSKIVPHPDGLTGQGTVEPWDGGKLDLPVHQILADGTDGHRIEFLLNEITPIEWRSRRNLEVTMPLSTMSQASDDGVRYLAPEIVLLYKARHMRPWDEADFEVALPALFLGQRHWLFHALEAEQPRHPWMRRLGVT
jgi:Aminoglycoside-2''-adenylyltransferase